MADKLLQMLAEKQDCFLSSLPNIAQTGKLTDVLRSVRTEEFSLDEWSYTLSYIFRRTVSLKDYKDLKLLLSQLK